MRKYILCSLLVFTVAAGPVLAAEHEEPARADARSVAGKDKTDSAVAEKSVATNHSVSINGRSYAYKATAGTLTIRDDKDVPDASVFYVAYTVGEGGGSEKRPVTFFYNGGPGSASLWLHMGSFGPMRVETGNPDYVKPAPYGYGPNPDTLLDKTDLVFIDAVAPAIRARWAKRRARISGASIRMRTPSPRR